MCCSYHDCTVNISTCREQGYSIYAHPKLCSKGLLWTDMIKFHFKQQFPTLANLGVDVAGAYVNKSCIFSVRKNLTYLNQWWEVKQV